MATLRAFEYGDPSKILELRESRSCKGCKHVARVFGVEYCEKDKTKPGRENMIRCRLYKPTGANKG